MFPSVTMECWLWWCDHNPTNRRTNVLALPWTRTRWKWWTWKKKKDGKIEM